MVLDLLTAPEEKLDEMLKSLGDDAGKMPAGRPSRSAKINAVKIGLIRKEERLTNQVRAENQVAAKEKLGFSSPDLATKRPSPEAVAIEASKLVKAVFQNRENPPTPEGEDGADVDFDKGPYHFKLYDGRTYAMPEIMVTSDPMKCTDVYDALVKFWMAPWPKQNPFDKPRAEKLAEGVMRDINLCYEDPDHQTRCTGPKHKRIKVKDVEDLKDGQLIAYDAKEAKGFLRFQFNIIGDAPKDAMVGQFLE